MDRHTVIFTADKRLEELSNLLVGRKVTCSWEEYCRGVGNIRDAEYVYVFPTPVNKLEEYPCIRERLKEDMPSQKIRSVFGGMFDKQWIRFFTENRISYVDFMKMDKVAGENARITAEAVIAELLQLSPYSIWRQQIFVTGFGACGKPIAEKLRALGACVTVVARSEDVREEASKRGYKTCDFLNWKEKAEKATSIINTVPALVITEEILQRMPKDAVVLDIASRPGGTDFAYARKRGIKTKLALGLPGIYSVKSSAHVYKKAIREKAPLQDFKRGEQSWIFQIII